MISRKAKFFVIMLVFPRSYNLPFCRHSAPMRLFNVLLGLFNVRLWSFNVLLRLFNIPLGLFNVSFG